MIHDTISTNVFLIFLFFYFFFWWFDLFSYKFIIFWYSIIIVFRRVTRGGGGDVSPAPFRKLEKSALIWRKHSLIALIYGYNVSFKMKLLRVSRGKTHRFFPSRAFLSPVVGECLSKCPNSKKLPCPKKFLVTAPAIITWLRLPTILSFF